MSDLFGHPIEQTAASALRRLQLIGRRLAVPVTPQLEEGLVDLFYRAISRNGISNGSSIWPRLAGMHRQAFSHFSFVDMQVDDETMATFLGTALGAYDISPLRYQKKGARSVTYFGTTIRLLSLSQHRRVSPRFLKSNGYHKAIWGLLPLGFDPTNREYLLESCPVCRHRLTFAKTRGMFFCHNCGDADDMERGRVDLRDHPQPEVELVSYENIDLAVSLIDPGLDHKRELARSLHSDLRILERGQVFEFIVLIAQLLDGLGGEVPEGSVSPHSLHEATDAVRRWPKGVIQIAEKMRDVWKTEIGGRKHRFFPQHPLSREVTSLKDFFGNEFPKILRNQLQAGLEPIAHPIDEQISQRVARFRRSMVRTRKIGGLDVADPSDRFAFAVLSAQETQSVRIEVRATGLSLLELVNLYDRGLALCSDDHIARYLSETGDHLFQEKILAISQPLSGEPWLLLDAVLALSKGRVTWSSVISEILAGNLPVALADGNEPLLKRLKVLDIGKLDKICQVEAPHERYDQIVLRNRDVGFYLGIGAPEVVHLVAAGLLPSGGISFSAIRQFHMEHINPAEILRFLKIKRHYTRSVARIFGHMLKEGIAPIHKKPSTRKRAAVEEYFRSLGY